LSELDYLLFHWRVSIFVQNKREICKSSLASSQIEIPEPWRAILKVAARTPSPHNTQPWKVHVVDAERAQLFLDHRRALPAEDTTGCFIMCALGMFSEAFRVIGSNLGISLKFERANDFKRDGDFSYIGQFERTKEAVKPNKFSNEVFLRRQTSRLKLYSDIASEEEISGLKAIADRSGHAFHHIIDRDEVNQILKYNLQAVVEDLGEDKYNSEIKKWFRYTDQEAEQKKDGLSARCMTIPGGEFRFFAEHAGMAHWPILGPIIRARYRRRVGGAPQIGILSGKFFDNSSAFEAGGMFMELWAELARLDLYLHPFGNLITNLEARKKVVELTKIQNPWIIFRFGKSELPPRSLRLDIEELCT